VLALSDRHAMTGVIRAQVRHAKGIVESERRPGRLVDEPVVGHFGSALQLFRTQGLPRFWR
jgi:hypothetical protein